MNKNDKIAENETLSVETEQEKKSKPVFLIVTIAVLAVILVTVVVTLIIAFNKKNDNDNIIFGYYDKIPITWVQGNIFTQYYERALLEYQYWAQRQGRDVNDPTIMYYVWREAYEGTVMHTALLQMGKKSKYTPTKKVVDRSVAMSPRFQDNGNFSSKLYNEMPEDERKKLWLQTRDELIKIMFFNDYFELLTSSGEAEFVAKMSTPMRSFDMVSFDIDDYPESEYLAYAKENAADFDDPSDLDNVREYVGNFARGRMEDWAIEQANEFCAQAKESGFRSTVAARGKRVNSFGPLPVNYGGIELFDSLDSFTIPGIQSYLLKEIGLNEDFWKIAFSTPLNTPSEPLVQGSNVLVFFPTEEKDAEVETVEYLVYFYQTDWVKYVSERSLQSFFVNSEKMDDRFSETYMRIR